MLNVGVPVTKTSVDNAFGGIAVRFADLMADAEQANVWLAGIADADLTALGYSDDDITALKDAAYAYGVLAQVYTGAVAVDPATDFRVSIRKLAGPG
jgi:hypothetical protein